MFQDWKRALEECFLILTSNVDTYSSSYLYNWNQNWMLNYLWKTQKTYVLVNKNNVISVSLVTSAPKRNGTAGDCESAILNSTVSCVYGVLHNIFPLIVFRKIASSFSCRFWKRQNLYFFLYIKLWRCDKMSILFGLLIVWQWLIRGGFLYKK